MRLLLYWKRIDRLFLSLKTNGEEVTAISAYAGINGDVWLSTSPPTALGSPESVADSGDHIHYFTATHPAWDWTKTLTVQCSPNGSSGWATVTDYIFFWPAGEVVFNTARVPGTNNFVRLSAGSYFTLSALGGAHMWKATGKAATKDVTPFQASGHYQQNIATIKSWTFSVDCFSQDARIMNEMVTGMSGINTSGGVIVCQLWWDETNGRRYQFFALPTQLDTTVVSSDVDKQTVQMTVTGPLYQITSNTFTTATVTRM
jgi:hypothetical protein